MSGIYIASKAKHGQRWNELREKGLPICSSWIYEYKPGATRDWAELWARCVRDIETADALIVYSEPGEVLRGALVELGIGMAFGVPAFWVGPVMSVCNHAGVETVETLREALMLAEQIAYAEQKARLDG